MSKEATDNFVRKWALVTGASSGLGLEFADLLAAQKVNLVLAARRRESMDKLASDLRSKYGVDVLVEAINLAAPVPGLARFPAAQAWLDEHPHGSQASQ